MNSRVSGLAWCAFPLSSIAFLSSNHHPVYWVGVGEPWKYPWFAPDCLVSSQSKYFHPTPNFPLGCTLLLQCLPFCGVPRKPVSLLARKLPPFGDRGPSKVQDSCVRAFSMESSPVWKLQLALGFNYLPAKVSLYNTLGEQLCKSFGSRCSLKA